MVPSAAGTTQRQFGYPSKVYSTERGVVAGGGAGKTFQSRAGHRHPTYTSSSNGSKEASFPSAKLKAALARLRELDASATGNTLKLVNANEDHMMVLRKVGRQLCRLSAGRNRTGRDGEPTIMGDIFNPRQFQ